jgi:hypothetical protein
MYYGSHQYTGQDIVEWYFNLLYKFNFQSTLQKNTVPFKDIFHIISKLEIKTGTGFGVLILYFLEWEVLMMCKRFNWVLWHNIVTLITSGYFTSRSA